MLGAFGAIFLGAVGSGFWDLFLADFIEWVQFIFLTFWGRLFSGYLDHLHLGIKNGPIAGLVLLPFSSITITIIIFPWVMIFYGFRLLKRFERRLMSTDEQDEEINVEDFMKVIRKWRFKFKLMLIPLTFVLSILYMEILFSAVYVGGASRFVEHSIDILSPHLKRSEILQLRADYRSVRSAGKFYALENRIQNYSKKFEVEIPSFSSIR